VLTRHSVVKVRRWISLMKLRICFSHLLLDLECVIDHIACWTLPFVLVLPKLSTIYVDVDVVVDCCLACSLKIWILLHCIKLLILIVVCDFMFRNSIVDMSFWTDLLSFNRFFLRSLRLSMRFNFSTFSSMIPRTGASCWRMILIRSRLTWKLNIAISLVNWCQFDYLWWWVQILGIVFFDLVLCDDIKFSFRLESTCCCCMW